MSTVTLDVEKLREIIRETVREAVNEAIDREFNGRFMELMLRSLPYVSDEEQREIEELYGEPSKEVAKVLTLERK